MQGVHYPDEIKSNMTQLDDADKLRGSQHAVINRQKVFAVLLKLQGLSWNFTTYKLGKKHEYAVIQCTIDIKFIPDKTCLQKQGHMILDTGEASKLYVRRLIVL